MWYDARQYDTTPANTRRVTQMSSRTGLTLGAVAAVAVMAAALPADEKPDKADGRSRQAVELYLKAFKAEDIDGVMKHSGVPFVMYDRGRIEREQDLRAEFARLFDRSDMGELEFEVKAVGTLEEVKDELGEVKHEGKLKAVVGDGDRVVLVDADFGKRKETMSFAVSARDVKFRVIAMFD